MHKNTNYIILGGGCAGLSFAAHLLHEGLKDKHITIIEPRKTYSRDRTWCYWKVTEHLFSCCVSHRWPKMKMCTESESIIRELGEYAFEYIKADDYYKAAQAMLAQYDNVELLLDTHSVSIHEQQDRIVIETNKGTINADYLFDSRPPDLDKELIGRNDYMLQCFVGWGVRTENPIFDPTVFTLLDLDTSTKNPVFAYYILPTNECEAVICPIYFFRENIRYNDEVYEQRIKSYLAKNNSGNYQILHKEKAILPMMLFDGDRRHPTARTYKLGAAAGLSRGVTAELFLNIQRYNAQLAKLIVNNDFVTTPNAFSKQAYFTDSLFLKRLHQHPEKYAEIEMKFLRNTPIDTAIRYLEDCMNDTDFSVLLNSFNK